jgi:metal-responsive CopG/Arc/MetJ family transcriptional regulator
MANKRVRLSTSGFVGIQLTPELLIKLDEKIAETTLNRSQIIRLALIEYLGK